MLNSITKHYFLLSKRLIKYMKDINQGIAIWRKTWDGINLSCMVGLLLVAVLGTLGSAIAGLIYQKITSINSSIPGNTYKISI